MRTRISKIKILSMVFMAILMIAVPIHAQNKTKSVVKSYNYPKYLFYAKPSGIQAAVSRIKTCEDRAFAIFEIVPGLVGGGTISFESAILPGYYLRHMNGAVFLHRKENTQLFLKDASFSKVPGLADRTKWSFQSVNYPDYYIRHRDALLYIETEVTNPETFAADATFQILEFPF